jgi:hypothetical protein
MGMFKCGERHDALPGSVIEADFSRQAPRSRDGNAVLDRPHLRQIARYHQNGKALAGKLAHERMDLGPRSNIHTTRRFIDDVHTRLRGKAFRKNHFKPMLIVQAVNVAESPLHLFAGKIANDLAAQKAAARGFIDARHQATARPAGARARRRLRASLHRGSTGKLVATTAPVHSSMRGSYARTSHSGPR